VAAKQQLFRPVSLTRKGIGNEEGRSEAQSRPDLTYNVELTSAGCCRVFNALYSGRHKFDLFQHKN
jgi:hypothetical protein